MFTGIIETTGHISEVIINGTNKTFWISTTLTPELKIDQSLSHNGVCLTVEEVRDNQYRVTAIEETLKKTTLDSWNTDDVVNLERSLLLNGRLDGHLVQGHVDTTATCIKKQEKKGSWEFTFRFPAKFAPYIIEKGSVSINGISLTVFNIGKKKITVAVIPYTYTHTNLQNLKEGEEVNMEFDMVGKYVVRSQK